MTDRWAMTRALGLVVLMGLVLISGGCATTADPRPPVEVLIPVAAQCPAPVMPERPVLPVADLTDKSVPADVLRAYAVSLSQCAAYSAQLETLLRAYQPATATDTDKK